MNTINVVLIEPGKKAKIAEIGTELEDMQEFVGGSIETYYPFEEQVCIVCNDEGKLDGSRPNRAIYDEDDKMVEIIFGKFFICDCSGENFGSLSGEQLQRYREQFLMPEHFFKVGGEIQAVKFDPDRESR